MHIAKYTDFDLVVLGLGLKLALSNHFPGEVPTIIP
jgi:hypothetical protein